MSNRIWVSLSAIVHIQMPQSQPKLETMSASQFRPSTPINDAELGAGKSEKLWNDKLYSNINIRIILWEAEHRLETSHGHE